MAVSNLDFASQVDAWVSKTRQRMESVFKESTQRTVSAAQAMIPVDTGYARASIRASLTSMPSIDPASFNKEGAPIPYDGAEVAGVIAAAELGGTIYVGWTARYVQFLENGHSKQAPSGFVRIAAMQFPDIVAQVTAEAKSRAGA
jgi:hypothetical protein